MPQIWGNKNHGYCLQKPICFRDNTLKLLKISEIVMKQESKLFKWKYFSGWMLSDTRNKKAAKKFFKKTLSNKSITKPSVVNVDKNPAFVPAHAELQKSGDLDPDTKLRRVKYLNNSVENDHKFIKSKSRYRQWYQNFETAGATIDAIEKLCAWFKNTLFPKEFGCVRPLN